VSGILKFRIQAGLLQFYGQGKPGNGYDGTPKSLGLRHGMRAASIHSGRRFLKIRDYSNPEARNRLIGSTAGTGSRLNNQRATANPNAA